MKTGISNDQKIVKSNLDDWMPSFPNPADFRFDYFKLMNESVEGLAKIKSPKRVAIIGAGVAGLLVARELHRCGFEVTIFEASNRIGGRLYTQENPNGKFLTSMEMGAMRMPFFGRLGDNNSLLEYYLYTEAGDKGKNLLISDFPNPGIAEGGTGIYINQGYGPKSDFKKPTLISWDPPSHKAVSNYPDNPDLKRLCIKVNKFLSNFALPAQKYYALNNDEWTICWNKIVKHYSNYTFGDIVRLPAFKKKEINFKIKDPLLFDGNLGGFGMNFKESELLATIGIGDGSWGAFFYIASLWFLRCTCFGYVSNLKTIEGLANAQNLPYYDKEVFDSKGQQLTPPLYRGMQSLVEFLFYSKPNGANSSLYEGANLFINTSVSELTKKKNGIEIKYGNEGLKSEFDYVVVTTTQWASEISIRFKKFSQNELPPQKITTHNIQHNITSCKLFFPLKKKYWKDEKGNRIPQVIITDSYIQDVYALSWESIKDDPGVLLASYTWEDDALKLLAYDVKALSELVLKKLQQITKETVGQDITEFIDKEKPVVIHWIQQPTYNGCAKLYRERNEEYNQLDLSYNQNFSSKSNLYFAGENYSVEGGWTEPALRSGLDCVLQLLSNEGAEFCNTKFNFKRDYPKW